MHTIKSIARMLVVPLMAVVVAAQQPQLAQLEKQFQKQYASIQSKFADGPEPALSPAERHEMVGKWQDELAARFARAAATAGEIMKLQPPNLEMWREQRDTLLLYSQPISPPETRTVFGDTEVQKKARIFKQPLAVYPDEARQAKAKGEVRLRLVLAFNGTVQHIFAIKPAKHGLTEAAIAAARLIEFEPAVRDGRRASQYATFVYKFEDGKALPPSVPATSF